jgi:hypothetical protein
MGAPGPVVVSDVHLDWHMTACFVRADPERNLSILALGQVGQADPRARLGHADGASDSQGQAAQRRQATALDSQSQFPPLVSGERPTDNGNIQGWLLRLHDAGAHHQPGLETRHPDGLAVLVAVGEVIAGHGERPGSAGLHRYLVYPRVAAAQFLDLHPTPAAQQQNLGRQANPEHDICASACADVAQPDLKLMVAASAHFARFDGYLDHVVVSPCALSIPGSRFEAPG